MCWKDIGACHREQIDRQNYTQELEEHGIKRIVKYGIAFSGKSVEVKTEDTGAALQ